MVVNEASMAKTTELSFQDTLTLWILYYTTLFADGKHNEQGTCRDASRVGAVHHGLSTIMDDNDAVVS